MKGIKNWAPDDRPREKLVQKGAAALSDAELLAILINSGNVRMSALDIAQHLLATHDNSFVKLGELSVEELQQYDGIGQAKAVTIVAALEIARRRKNEIENLRKQVRQKLTSSIQVFQEISYYFADQHKEKFLVLFLNHANIKIKVEQISMGGSNATVVEVKEIVKRALDCKAAKVIIAHNHPSGNLEPSSHDIELTRKLRSALLLFDIPLLDHLIIGIDQYYSFADEGLMNSL